MVTVFEPLVEPLIRSLILGFINSFSLRTRIRSTGLCELLVYNFITASPPRFRVLAFLTDIVRKSARRLARRPAGAVLLYAVLIR